ncbi:MAG TPA: dTDP-4-dehydrorhamnose 3,5-epimerase [Azospirillum sp.]|nr:dTDP-4-dehydrorhamnose 3,5-epimerase [Azospirillum sp.]
MDIQRLAIPEILVLKPAKFGDERGFFSETYNRKRFAEAGIDLDFVQDNHARSAQVGTVRGLHFQTPPFAQDKLLRVVKGAVLDVAVDVRHGSPTFGRHVAVELSEGAWNQILVPVGFAHGYCTLMPDTEVIYKVTNYYAPKNDAGILWNDPDLGIEWPVRPEEALLSDKDRVLPRLAELPVHFTHAG